MLRLLKPDFVEIYLRTLTDFAEVFMFFSVYDPDAPLFHQDKILIGIASIALEVGFVAVESATHVRIKGSGATDHRFSENTWYPDIAFLAKVTWL